MKLLVVAMLMELGASTDTNCSCCTWSFQINACVMGMFDLKDYAAFKQHLRDFLVQVSSHKSWHPSAVVKQHCSHQEHVVDAEAVRVSAIAHLRCEGNTSTAPGAHTQSLHQFETHACLFTTFRSHPVHLQTKAFVDRDNAELFADEVAAQAEEARKKMSAIPGMVPPNQLADDMADA